MKPLRHAALGLLMLPTAALCQIDGAARAGRVAVVGPPAADLRIIVRAGERTDTIRPDADGVFLLPAHPNGETLHLAAETGGSHHPALLELHPDSIPAEIGIVLVPRRWAIQAGRYRGTSIEIVIRDSFYRDCERCPVFLSRRHAGEVFQWQTRGVPVAAAFDRESSSSRISRGDSARFWTAVAEMEMDAGMDLFRPVPYAAVAADPENAVLVWTDPSLRRFSAWTSVGVDGRGRITTAVVAFRSFPPLFRPEGAALIPHEMVHALGFGHTCAWRSVVADRSRCPGLAATRLTPHDVGHIQLAAAVGEAAFRLGTDRPWGPTVAALRGESSLQDVTADGLARVPGAR